MRWPHGAPRAASLLVLASIVSPLWAAVIVDGSVVRAPVGATHDLQRRGDCKTIVVQSGDSCSSLASKCGISGADITKYNPSTNFCSKLMPLQKICCSAGTIPTPSQNSNGTCATHFVQRGETCSVLALSNGLSEDDIEGFNKGVTWGWTGCSSLPAGINICLSEGKPPLPAPYDNAICGPMKPGTTWPDDGTKIEDLNPCPLNACCNIWGQCGITDEFCHVYKSPEGNPGYSPPNTSGCISNCGTEIVNKDNGPVDYGRIGYWESWNLDRPCGQLPVAKANKDGGYTHIHWAFANIDKSSFKPSINDTYKQWDDFLALEKVRRIVSFGGWGFSTSPETYSILRSAMEPANRDTFVDNIVSFVNDNGLDGVDIDWEYPGAPDSIGGIPVGPTTDGPNYLKFVSALKGKLGPDKSLSIAAPASYWYLKSFPLKKMQSYLDYIVFMTYDLHGQWDAGNNYSMEGCPGGNCLRSHVNITETMNALAMITKAGVPTNKIFVGESSYGRSFGMSDPSCSGPMCTFTGDRDHSTAEKGKCTGTAGYISNGEIFALMDSADDVTKWYDEDSDSDMMTWNDGQWVAYMTPTTRDRRRDAWKQYNFAGTIDWAVDLQSIDSDFGTGGPKLALDTNFPDPSLVLDPKSGSYYSFATAGNNYQIQTAARFQDERDWKTLQLEPMTTVGAWAAYHDIWAPDVQQLSDGTWVMYYSAPSAKNADRHCVGAATSTYVSGPYTPRDEAISCDLNAGGAIDPSGFYDARSDTRWVVYKIDGNSLGGGGPCRNEDGKHKTPIMLQQVESDGVTMIGKPIQILDRGKADGPLIEAPNLVYEDNKYLLFFSSNCYSTPLYDISYATADNIKGPYTKSAAPLLVTGNFSLTSPGGASSDGKGHMVFHANCPSGKGGRCMFQTDYQFESGIVTIR